MADETVTPDAGAEGAEPQVELRACAYCGAAIHPQSHRCGQCGGHVGLAWHTVHKELWLFVFASVLILAGCLASWTGRVAAAPADDPSAFPGRHVAEAAGAAITGLDTIRGTFMFALAIYGVIAGIFNVLFRRMIVWPFLINSLLALWVGIGGILSSVNSAAWDSWKKVGDGKSLLESFLGPVRAIPPAFFLLTLAGLMVLLKLVGGILAAAGKSRGQAQAAQAARKEAGSRRRSKAGGGDAPPTDAPPADAPPTA